MTKRTKALTYVLSLALAAGNMLTSCEEVKEAGEYDNWQERNEAFTDSIGTLAGTRIISTAEDADNMTIGEYYAIKSTATTNKTKEYVYVRKLTNSTDGVRPYYTDKVSTFYYGTYINGAKFDGNFTGYSATDKGTLDGSQKQPTQFDSPSDFTVSSVITGWTCALQFMREGERWMMYVPYGSAYGASGSSSVLGYSCLTFDVVLRKVYDR